MTLGRLGKNLLRRVNIDVEPYPWVGSGTHAWLHYDSGSTSHVCQIQFRFEGTITIDWGDGSETETVTNSSSSVVTKSHTYQNGMFRLDITGAVIDFGSYTWNGSAFTYKNYYGCGFMTDDSGFSTNYVQCASRRDALLQFETDATSFVGVGNPGYFQLGTCRNLKWMKFTEATVIANAALGNMIGLIGLFAPKCLRVWNFVSSYAFPSLRKLELPSLASLFDEANARQGTWFYEMPCLEEFDLASTVTMLPSNFLQGCLSLRQLTLSSGLSGTLTALCAGGCRSINRIIIPEGITELAGESFRIASNAEYVEFPSTFTTVSNTWAFYGMTGLKTIVCKATTPPTLAHNYILNGG